MDWIRMGSWLRSRWVQRDWYSIRIVLYNHGSYPKGIASIPWNENFRHIQSHRNIAATRGAICRDTRVRSCITSLVYLQILILQEQFFKKNSPSDRELWCLWLSISDIDVWWLPLHIYWAYLRWSILLHQGYLVHLFLPEPLDGA